MNTVKLSTVKLKPSLSWLESKGRLLNADACYIWIRRHDKLVGWTYNYNPSSCLIDYFARLISCLGPASKKVRIANNIHMKCYINKESMLVTSFNLSYPTVQDMGIEVFDIVL